MMRTLTILTAVLGAVAAVPSSNKVGFISVSVATVWTNPSKPRSVDKPALTNPARIERWLHSMSTAQFLDLTTDSRTQTQALYGNLVHILGSKDGWYEIAVAGQPTPKNSLGYPGWVPAAQIAFDNRFGQLQASSAFAEVNKKATAWLYRDAKMADKIMSISYDTKLPLISQKGKSIQVAVPGGGSAYMSTDDATVFKSASAIPYPTGEDLVASSKLFLGRPYLWGGTSAQSFDCAGLTHTLYDSYGITIGRDADAQADLTPGIMVDKADLQAGDIIFYASNLSDPSTIYHDAMYVGKGKMVESFGAGVPTRITGVRFNSDYWGAQRYLVK